MARHPRRGTVAPGKTLRQNERIRISPIFLIDQNENQVGAIETFKALEMAREAGLDLVEVAPQSTPPVCRIMDYGKWKYEQSKKERKSRAQRHETELKEIRIKTPKIDPHDLGIKVNHAREFLERGDRVQFSLRFRGRELAHIDEGIRIFKDVEVQLEEVAKVDQPPRREGRRITMLLAPLARKAPPKPPKPPKDKPKPKPEAEADAPPEAQAAATAPTSKPAQAPEASPEAETPPAEPAS